MFQRKHWNLNALYLALAGGVLLNAVLAPMASAQLVTLEDLRKAMQNSEAERDDASEASPEPDAGDPPDIVETTETRHDQSDVITLDDLRAALGIPAEPNVSPPANEDEPIQQANIPAGEPPTVSEPDQTASAPPVIASASNGNYDSPLENWTCNVSLRSVRAADKSEGGFGTSGSKFSLYFDTADYSITRDSMVALARETGTLLSLALKGEKLAVIGYTDAAGNAQSNIILSLQRAYNTKACLIEITGLDPDDIIVQGHGSFSVVREPQEALNSANRRADIMLYSDYMARFETTFAALNQPR